MILRFVLLAMKFEDVVQDHPHLCFPLLLVAERHPLFQNPLSHLLYKVSQLVELPLLKESNE